MSMFTHMLEADRRRNGFTVRQVACRLGIKPWEYRELETGTGYPTFEVWDRLCKLYGWRSSGRRA